MAVGLNLLSIVARAGAWDTVIKSAMPEPHPSPPLVFSAFCVGMLGNVALPGRVGELARVAVLTRHLRRHPSAQPVVLVVTDGEPTAHLEDYNANGGGSSVFFDYPPHPRTIAHTVRGFDDVARLGAQVTIFRLGNDAGLARFIDQIARRVEGRVVVPDLDGLGAAVVGDYLRSRRHRR